MRGSHSLVVEDDVRKPDQFGRDPEFLDAFIFVWIPPQPVVVPFLQGGWGVGGSSPSLLSKTLSVQRVAEKLSST